MVRRVFTAAAVALILSAGPVLVAAPATGAGASIRIACSQPHRFQCRAVVVVPVKPSSNGGSTSTSGGTSLSPSAVVGYGYTAADLQTIYQTTNLTPAGATPTIAIIDAYGYPTAEADLAMYRSAMGLPPCSVASGCLKLVNQDLQTAPLPSPPTNPKNDWTIEAALDLDMASAICPACNLMLVEASDSGNGLVNGALSASTITPYVSMSWGGADDPKIPADLFDIPGTIFVGASGDYGYSSTPDFPSTLTNVIAVGGVSLSAVGATATAWSGAGSSCSTRVPQSAPQTSLTTGCSYKAATDLSALADPNTGAAVYDNYTPLGDQGWYEVGGTSAATPMVAALYALVGNHTDPWAGYATVSTHPSLMEDVTSGSNGVCGAPLCDSGSSWDGPTGIGMPLSPEAVALPLTKMTLKIGHLAGEYQVPFSLTVPLPTTVPDTAGTPQTLASTDAQVTGLPAGLSGTVSNGSLQISGTPTKPGTGTATMALAGTTPAGRTTSGHVSVSWSIARATMIPDGTVEVLGHIRHHRRVHASLPTVYTNSLNGTVAQPTWKVKWFLNGTRVHTGMHYRLPRGSKGMQLRVKAHARLRYHFPLTLKSLYYTVR